MLCQEREFFLHVWRELYPCTYESCYIACDQLENQSWFSCKTSKINNKTVSSAPSVVTLLLYLVVWSSPSSKNLMFCITVQFLCKFTKKCLAHKHYYFIFFFGVSQKHPITIYFNHLVFQDITCEKPSSHPGVSLFIKPGEEQSLS